MALHNLLKPIYHYDVASPQKELRAIEYPLSGDEMPDDIRRSLHPWLNEFIGSTVSQSGGILSSRWSAITHEFLLPLRNQLLSYVARSIIVLSRRDAWLVTVTPTAMLVENPDLGDCWFIAPPPDPPVVAARITELGMAQLVGIRQFLYCFGGLAERAPYLAGGFCRVNELRPLEQLYPYVVESPSFEFWKNAVTFYKAHDGNIVLLHPSGKTAWWYLGSNEAFVLRESFAGFVEYYSQYLLQNTSFGMTQEDFTKPAQ